jgi:hypothetical protein
VIRYEATPTPEALIRQGTSGFGTSRHFTAIQNLVAIGHMDIGQAAPIKRDL